MPNTLAHIALNGILSKPIIRNDEIIWIYLGTVIPDFPWILKRIINLILPSINGYDLQAYLISMASLFFSILLSFFLAQFTKYTKRVLLMLCFGSLFHLLLDALQTKWANGIQLFLPFSWEITSFNLFWPESIYTYILTISGAIFIFYSIKNNASFPKLFFSTRRIAIGILVLITYFILPYFFIEKNYDNNSHFIATLKNANNRVNKYVEMDRKEYKVDSNGEYWIKSFNNDYFKIKNIDKVTASNISIRGKFSDNETIEVIEHKENWDSLRDAASYFGLSMILIHTLIMIKNRKSGN